MDSNDNAANAAKPDKQQNGNNTPAEKQSQEKISSSTSSQSLRWRTKSILEKIRYIREHTTVEPMLACYIMPSVLASLATQNLNLEKACRVNLKYEPHICDALADRNTANYTKEEAAVQLLVASMQGWKTIIQSFLPCMLILFLGAWSDRIGRRKPCMLLPIIGEFLTTVGLIVNTYFFDELPMEVAGVTEALFPGLTGGWVTMFMGIFSYIADVTTEETRTFRIGIVNLFCSLGIPVGMALSGILLKEIGFYGIFSISAVLYLISFIYGYYSIHETPTPCSSKEKLDEIPTGCMGSLRNFFDLEHVKDTFKVAFKKGEGNRRMRVAMLMIVVCVVIGPMHGEMVVMYLFTRYRFNWNEVDFSIFSTYSVITNLCGTLFSVSVFSQIMKIDDAIIGIMSSMSKILSSFVYAFAVTKWQIYLAPLVEILNGTSFIAMRAIASKLVASDELGKVNSLFGVCEAMMPLVYAPMYTTLYARTIDKLPGAFFLLGGALTVPAVFIFGWMYKEYKKDRLLKQTEVEAVTNNTQKAGIVNTAFQSDDEKVGTNVGDKRISNMIKDRSDRRSVDVTAHNEHHRPSIAELNIAQTVKCTSKI